MTHHKMSESFVEEVCSAVLESCCRVVIIPLCEDNIRRLAERLKSEQEHMIMRATDLSRREVFIWMKKISNLKKRSESFLATHESRTGFCSVISFPFNNYIAAMLLQDWEKLDEDEPSGVLLPPDSTDAQLSRKSTAPIGAIEAKLSNYQLNGHDSSNRDVKRVETDRNYATDNLLVLNSLSFRGEGDQVARDLLSTLRMATAGNSATALVQSSRGVRFARSQSFEIIHDERWIVLDRRFL